MPEPTDPATPATPATPTVTPEPFNYDTWLSKQPEDVRKGLDDHTKGLKSALDGERNTRTSLEKQLRDAAAAAEKGSELEKKLTAQADQMALQEKRGAFYDAAHAAGAKNLKLAWLAAVDGDHFKKDGSPDIDALKGAHPELFATGNTTPGTAGNGTQTDPPKTGKSMDDLLRSAAGITR